MNVENFPNLIPIFPLNGALLLPNGNLPLNVFESRYLEMIDYAMKNEKMIGMIQEKEDLNNANDLYSIGCLGKITQYNETNDGRYLINLTGIIRFNHISEEKTQTKFRKLNVDYSKFKNDLLQKYDQSFNKKYFLNEVKNYLLRNGIEVDWEIINKVNETILITSLASICPFSNSEKQMLLECKNTDEIPNAMLNLFKMNDDSLASQNIN